MRMIISTNDLTLEDVPGTGAADLEIIRFAQTLNGYDHVGGQARDLGIYIERLEKQSFADLSLDDLRILLFARQRARYHQGGGWPNDDPLMDEMRLLTLEIRSRLEQRLVDK